MSVLKIEPYTTLAGDKILKVILKPTKVFPVGYFYTDDNEITRKLISSYSWFLDKRGKNTYVVANKGTNNTGQKILRFHQEYAYRLLGYYPDYIDHIDGVGLDNRNENLNEVNSKQNNRNRLSIGYTFNTIKKYFQPNYALGNKKNSRGSYKSEPEALLATYQLRQEVYADYNYNFYLDRRNDLDILNAELTGKITSQQAIYLHTKRLVEANPWYVYRYNLFEYCKANNITIPSFTLDKDGFMINPATGTKFCPY